MKLNKFNKNIFPYPLDVTKIDNCKSIAESIIKDLGKIDICVFGTGMHDPQSEKKIQFRKN